jgi:hypothetical protein
LTIQMIIKTDPFTRELLRRIAKKDNRKMNAVAGMLIRKEALRKKVLTLEELANLTDA